MEQNIIVVMCMLALEIHGHTITIIEMFEILGCTDVQILDAKLYLDNMACNTGDKENFSKYQHDVILGHT